MISLGFIMFVADDINQGHDISLKALCVVFKEDDKQGVIKCLKIVKQNSRQGKKADELPCVNPFKAYL